MRKINWLLAILVAVVLTSCGGSGNPVIFVKTEGPVTPDFENIDKAVLVGNVTAEENLTKVTFTTNFEDGSSQELEVPTFTNALNYEFAMSTELLGLNDPTKKGTSINITAVDANNGTAKKTVEVKYNEDPATELTEGTFEWKRIGGAEGTGLAQFGLEWKVNRRETMCVITPKTGTKLVNLTKDDYNLATAEELATTIDGNKAIEKFNQVSAAANNTYDLYIGTKTEDGKYFAINVKECKIVVNNDGSTITITGTEKH